MGERFHRCGASVDAGGWVTATRQTTDDRPEEAMITRRGGMKFGVGGGSCQEIDLFWARHKQPTPSSLDHPGRKVPNQTDRCCSP